MRAGILEAPLPVKLTVELVGVVKVPDTFKGVLVPVNSKVYAPPKEKIWDESMVKVVALVEVAIVRVVLLPPFA